MAHVEPGDAKDEHDERMARERCCSPTGFGLCSTHPSCEYVRACQRELWNKGDILSAGYRRMASALRQLREHLEHDGGATCDIGTMMRIIKEGEQP